MKKRSLRNSRFIVLFWIVLITPLHGQKPVTPNASTEAKALLEFIYSLCGKYTLTGQHNYPATKDRNSQFANEYRTIDLYRQLFDRYVNYHKLTNLVWVWNVDRLSTPIRKFSNFHPGNEYLDEAGNRIGAGWLDSATVSIANWEEKGKSLVIQSKVEGGPGDGSSDLPAAISGKVQSQSLILVIVTIG